jgi:hypothetical protein
LDAVNRNATVTVEAPPELATSIAQVNGKLHLYFSNFRGLRSHENAVPDRISNVRVKIKGPSRGVLHLVPFMGEETTVAGVKQGNGVSYVIPALERGAVAWIDSK